ncbi:hypothetical protein [Hoeflea sp.]|uniref:hypothetical protein n=1 Tax=Hoeflea sp. TaxID=1940281 RepID=UPI002AFE2210|nr:hypothetical protein [Hoeflea sp.]
MVEYAPHNRPVDNTRPNEHIRETTVVESGRSGGWIAALVLIVLLAIGGFVYWSADGGPATAPANTDAEINLQVAPEAGAPGTEAVDPAPAVPAAPTETAPADPAAAPVEPAPQNN